ncbi:CvpA family protein [Noviherbaspirillum galbum]|uniref:CvpA family protein n=1 Tax=Noviherbaspirillum galbum TaxID=2709383 RepID=A0A6B3SS56_9BURK|nr:CvpA family protein [Noviherbaspirillum galbum]NEX61636.1 CvpA family protein [Noviherbaspirillum galbum]
MTIFDYLVLFILLVSLVIGVLRGFVKEILALGSWIVSLVLANMYASVLAGMLPEAIPGETLRLIVAFLALFIGVRILMMLVGMLFDAMIKATGLSVADRALGSVFGLARGALIVVGAVLLCGMTALPKQPFWTGAMLSPYAEEAARSVLPFLPEAFSRQVQFSN